MTLVSSGWGLLCFVSFKMTLGQTQVPLKSWGQPLEDGLTEKQSGHLRVARLCVAPGEVWLCS